MRVMSLLVMCLMLFFTAAHRVQAAPVGNIAKPALLENMIVGTDEEDPHVGLIAEGEFDVGIDRGLTNQAGEDAVFEFYGGKLGAVLNDVIILYGLIGSAKYEETVTTSGSTVKYETSDNAAFGGGATVLLFDHPLSEDGDVRLAIGADVKYRRVKFDLATVIIDGTTFESNSPSLSNVKTDYQDWQIAGAVALVWKQISPYIGVKYFDTDATFRVRQGGTTFNSQAELDDNVGVFIGAEVLITGSVSAYAEYRFIDEEAISIGGTIRF